MQSADGSERFLRPDGAVRNAFDTYHVQVSNSEKFEHCAKIRLCEIERIYVSVRISGSLGLSLDVYHIRDNRVCEVDRESNAVRNAPQIPPHLVLKLCLPGPIHHF